MSNAAKTRARRAWAKALRVGDVVGVRTCHARWGAYAVGMYLGDCPDRVDSVFVEVTEGLCTHIARSQRSWLVPPEEVTQMRDAERFRRHKRRKKDWVERLLRLGALAIDNAVRA